jgi:protein required for attachment to host cells
MSTQQDTTWYVVADGTKARILMRVGESMRTKHSFDSAGHGDTDENASADVSNLKAPKSDPSDQAKGRFAQHVAARLNEAVRTKETDAIVLAAPGHVLHDIREALDKPASAALKGTQSKDLTNIPDKELASHFG